MIGLDCRPGAQERRALALLSCMGTVNFVTRENL
jgi:hypothetical protein